MEKILGIGNNIKELRIKTGYTQEELASKCDIANTTLCAYENDNKNPSLPTLMKIAKALNVTIDRLCYGEESYAFINNELDMGKKIVNAFYFLWKEGMISEFDLWGLKYVGKPLEYVNGQNGYLTLVCRKHQEAINRMLSGLDQYEKEKELYGDNYEDIINMLLESVATQINMEIKEEREELERRKKRIEANKKRPN